jgi:hypothetical protein
MLFWFRGWMAAQTTVEVYKEHPVRVAVLTVLIDAAAALGTYAVHQAAWAVAVAIVLGTLSVIVIVFLWAVITAPRRELEVQVEALSQGLEAVRAQVEQLVIQRYGEPLQFLPIYQQLRVDVRAAIRIIGHAHETGKLWPRTGAPDDDEWKKHSEAIATSPWARLDGIHGELLEAFDHIHRLVIKTTMRFGAGRVVRSHDDLDLALHSLHTADAALTGAIDRLESLSALQKPEGADELEGFEGA